MGGFSLLSPLSFCSDRAVPAADSSALKHENTRDPPPVFCMASFLRGGVKRAPTDPPAQHAEKPSGRGLSPGQGNKAAPCWFSSAVGSGDPRPSWGSDASLRPTVCPALPPVQQPEVVLGPVLHMQQQPAAMQQGCSKASAPLPGYHPGPPPQSSLPQTDRQHVTGAEPHHCPRRRRVGKASVS